MASSEPEPLLSAPPRKRAKRKRHVSTRNDRFQARISARQRELLEKAALLEGRTLTDFVLSYAQEAAQKTVREHRLLSLSERDAAVFFTALATDWEPGDEIREDVRRMRGLFDGD